MTESRRTPPLDEEERRRELGELRLFKLQKLCAEQGSMSPAASRR